MALAVTCLDSRHEETATRVRLALQSNNVGEIPLYHT